MTTLEHDLFGLNCFFDALAGLDPAIHVFLPNRLHAKTWTPGPSPGEAILLKCFNLKRLRSRSGSKL
jgi:hypothetical protein